MEHLVVNQPERTFEEFYKDEEKDMNNFSYWFPYVKDIFKCPQTVIIKLPIPVADTVLEDKREKNKEKVRQFVESECLPKIRENITTISPFVFMKNARFSNKFDFNNSCRVYKETDDITNKLCYINYAGMCVDALGFTEVVFREFIDFEDEETATIYNGMPIRPEYRVFYDFDKKKIVHIHDYWDFDYVYGNLQTLTDKIVFSNVKDDYQEKWKEYLPLIQETVEKSRINEVTNLKGCWSMDFLYANEEVYLIDMAQAKNSAYREYCKVEV